MGVIIKARDLPAHEHDSVARPIIYCYLDQALDAQAISLNVELAKKLSAIKPNRRTMRMEQCFQQVVLTLADDVLIKDFDVMFNPEYEVDVLKVLCSVARNKLFRVLWPGKFENGRLIYAEEGFCDYRAFEISKYDVTVVV